MSIRLTDGQIEYIWNNLSNKKVVDLLANDVENSVAIICDFIHSIDGLVFLAHPYLYGMKDTLKELSEINNKLYYEYYL